MENNVSYNRQLSVFKPALFSKTVDVIGAGATGSHVVYLLAKMGVQNIRAIDFDVIEAHNIPNQIYGIKDVGKNKVDALKDIIFNLTDITIIPENMKIDAHCNYKPGHIVFLLTDTMASRQEIFTAFLKHNFGVNIVIETRMGIDSGRVYSIIPSNVLQVDKWEATLYSDEVSETSMCGSSVSVITTAVNIATVAVWQMLKYVNNEKIENEIIYGMVPYMSVCSQF